MTTIEEALAQIPAEWRGRGKIEWWKYAEDGTPTEVRAEFHGEAEPLRYTVGYGPTIVEAVLQAAERARRAAEDPDWGP